MASDAAVTTAFNARDKVLIKSLSRIEGRLGKIGNTAQRSFDKASRSGSRFGDIVKGIIVADVIKRGARALWDMAKGAVQLASDLMEVQNVVDVTFRGDAPIINKWAKNAINAFGISELQAKKFTGTMGAMIKSSGISGDQLVNMSTKLTGLSGDFASFFNLPIEEAFGKIRAGISGETEPLKQLGINMSVANLQAFALTKGITKSWKAMTQAEQVQLRFNFLMKASADAQGDFSRTLEESMANQQRVMSTRFEQASATIMKGFIPVITKAMGIVNKKLASINFDKMAEKIKIGIDAFISFSKIVAKAVIPVVKSVASTVKIMANEFAPFASLVIGMLIPGIQIAFNIFKALIPVLQFLAPIIPALVAGMIAYNAALKVQAGLQAAKMFFGMVKAIQAAAASQGLLNIVMDANPIGAVIIAITALIAVGVLLFKNWDLVKRKFFEWTSVFDNPIFAGIATILLPFVTIPILIARNWERVAAVVSNAIDIAKKAGSAVAGFLGFGDAATSPQIETSPQATAPPITSVNDAIITKTGKVIKTNPDDNIIATKNEPQREAPNAEQARARAQNVNFQGQLNIAGAPPGSTVESKTEGAPPVQMNLLGANP